MQGWKSVVLVPCLLTFLAGCSGKSLLSADCHSCTEEESSWKKFSSATLLGSWRGTMESWKNDFTDPKRKRDEKKTDLKFLTAKSFLDSKGIQSCPGLLPDAVIANGIFWDRKSSDGSFEYETFGRGEEGQVAYGRVQIQKLNGQEFCKFQRFGRVMGMNRLQLPEVSFTQPGAVLKDARNPASVAKEQEYEIGVEFLRLDKESARPVAFAGDSRKPASAEAVERPPLMIRVSRVRADKVGPGAIGTWTGAEEFIYRLWKVN